jgi:hypothetical protein
LPEVSVKRYSTGKLTSVPVVAVILIDEALSADGAEANVAGFGVGGVVSGGIVSDGSNPAVWAVNATQIRTASVAKA